jgi:hypothetical protein
MARFTIVRRGKMPANRDTDERKYEAAVPIITDPVRIVKGHGRPFTGLCG